MEEIQKAFGHLKSSGPLLTKTRDSLQAELLKFQLLRANEENQWLNIDLSTELIVFQNNVDIRAFRKIMLKGETGVYRHLATCFAEASKIVDATASSGGSNFPMMRAPMYYLSDFYKAHLVNAALNKRLSEEAVWATGQQQEEEDDSLGSSLDSPTVVDFPHRGLFELLRLADVTCERTRLHGEEFERILKTWWVAVVCFFVWKVLIFFLIRILAFAGVER